MTDHARRARFASACLLAASPLFWTPASAAERPGLLASFSSSDGANHVIVPRPDMALEAGESPHPAIGPRFSALLRGSIAVLEGGEYRFDAGAATIRIDDRVVSDKPMALVAGKHRLEISIDRRAGPLQIVFRWRSGSFAWEPVPASVLTHGTVGEDVERDLVVEQGRELVESYGCANCHPTARTRLESRRGPDLAAIGSRTSRTWIYHWLERPREFRAGSVMPSMLDRQGRIDVSAYLSSLRGEETVSPDVTVHDVSRGRELFASIGCAACHGRDGPAVDDAGSLSLAGMGSKMRVGALARYLMDPEAVDPHGPMPSMLLQSLEARQLAAYLVESRKPGFERRVSELDKGDSRRGRQLVDSSGCLACHEIGGRQTAPRPAARPLEKLEPGLGCLSRSPADGLPRYGLDTGQRIAIASFLRRLRNRPEPFVAPLHEARRRIARLRCTACHELDGSGPRVAPVDRVPDLDGVGGKLRTYWLREVLSGKARVRPTCRTRMPHFSASVLGSLASDLARLAGERPGDDSGAPDIDENERATGLTLLGTETDRGGLSCISCHDVGDWRPVADEKGPRMLRMARRLRYDWFRRWMEDPARISSGTAMPAYFLGSPASEVEAAVRSLWGALELGERMPRISGVGEPFNVLGQEHLPVAAHEALMMRMYLPDATPSAIAIGLPAQGRILPVSLCFDASECRIAYAWYGGYLDLSPSLGKRADHPRLIGQRFLRMEEFPIRLGERDRIPRRRFRGYRIVDGFPELRYDVDGVAVTELIVPLRDRAGFEQRFRVENVTSKAWLVLGVHDGAWMTTTIGELDGGALEIPAGVSVRFDVRTMRGKRP